MNKNEYDLDEIKTFLKKVLVQNQTSLQDNMDSRKVQDTEIVVPANKNAPPLEDSHSKKIGGMWTLKHEISSTQFYEILIKTEIKGENALYLNNFCNHNKLCLNEVTILQENLLPYYHYITRHSDFQEYFLPYIYHPSYYWNAQTQ